MLNLLIVAVVVGCLVGHSNGLFKLLQAGSCDGSVTNMYLEESQCTTIAGVTYRPNCDVPAANILEKVSSSSSGGYTDSAEKYCRRAPKVSSYGPTQCTGNDLNPTGACVEPATYLRLSLQKSVDGSCSERDAEYVYGPSGVCFTTTNGKYFSVENDQPADLSFQGTCDSSGQTSIKIFNGNACGGTVIVEKNNFNAFTVSDQCVNIPPIATSQGSFNLGDIRVECRGTFETSEPTASPSASPTESPAIKPITPNTSTPTASPNTATPTTSPVPKKSDSVRYVISCFMVLIASFLISF